MRGTMPLATTYSVGTWMGMAWFSPRVMEGVRDEFARGAAGREGGSIMAWRRGEEGSMER